MERKIGEIFKCHDTFLQVWEAKESDGCNGCFFEECRPLCLSYKCTAQEREDGKKVQFKQISKTMTTEEAKRRAELYSALAEGKTIQYKSDHDEWVDLKMDLMCGIAESYKYRIKPEPKYRPFKSQEECWNEMLKHQPFGWIKALNGELFCIDKVFDEGVAYKHSTCRFEEYLDGNYTFADGTPFGIKEE